MWKVFSTPVCVLANTFVITFKNTTGTNNDGYSDTLQRHDKIHKASRCNNGEACSSMDLDRAREPRPCISPPAAPSVETQQRSTDIPLEAPFEPALDPLGFEAGFPISGGHGDCIAPSSRSRRNSHGRLSQEPGTGVESGQYPTEQTSHASATTPPRNSPLASADTIPRQLIRTIDDSFIDDAMLPHFDATDWFLDETMLGDENIDLVWSEAHDASDQDRLNFTWPPSSRSMSSNGPVVLDLRGLWHAWTPTAVNDIHKNHKESEKQMTHQQENDIDETYRTSMVEQLHTPLGDKGLPSIEFLVRNARLVTRDNLHQVFVQLT